MAALGQRKRKADEDVELDMVPIMNMFLVLIPFLLASSSFLPLKAINTSIPVQAETSAPSEPEKDKKKPDVKIKATLKLESNRIRLEATSDQLPEAKLKEMDAVVKKGADGKYAYQDLAKALQKILTLYPKSDTVLLVPSDYILYDDIVSTMDAAREHNKKKLFPNVVISGQVQ